MVPLPRPSLSLSLPKRKGSHSPVATGKEQLLMREVSTEQDHRAQTALTDFRLSPPHGPDPGNETPLPPHILSSLLHLH